MYVNFDIDKSQEIDYCPNKPKKRRKAAQEDYDYNDELLEREEVSDQRVEIEPFIKNFFVYAGKLKEAPKRIISKFNASVKKRSRNELKKEAKNIVDNEKDINSENENKSVSENVNKLNGEYENKGLIKNKKKLEIENVNKSVCDNENKSLDQIETEFKEKDGTNKGTEMDLSNKNIGQIENKSESKDPNNECKDIKTETKEINTEHKKSISSSTKEIVKNDRKNRSKSETESNQKTKFDICDEYIIKNEIILRNDGIMDDSVILEFLLNSLVIDQVDNAQIILNKLNIKESKILDDAYLKEQYEELNIKLCIEEIKLKNSEGEDYNNIFFENLICYIDLLVKIIYLDFFIKKKKRISEKTIKKKIKNQINEVLNDKISVYKQWPIKLYHYKKRTFFKDNAHYLNTTLSKSDIFESVDDNKTSADNNIFNKLA